MMCTAVLHLRTKSADDALYTAQSNVAALRDIEYLPKLEHSDSHRTDEAHEEQSYEQAGKLLSKVREEPR
jgi:hypothetical protein